MSMLLKIFLILLGQGMAVRSERTPLGAAFPEKPRDLARGSCHDQYISNKGFLLPYGRGKIPQCERANQSCLTRKLS